MTAAAVILAGQLMKANRDGGRSWRRISREDYQGRISAATLCRIALSGGSWLPKSRAARTILGVMRAAPVDLFAMDPSALTAALNGRQPMPELAPGIIDLFARLGWTR
jgi:hypothetical protein